MANNKIEWHFDTDFNLIPNYLIESIRKKRKFFRDIREPFIPQMSQKIQDTDQPKRRRKRRSMFSNRSCGNLYISCYCLDPDKNEIILDYAREMRLTPIEEKCPRCIQ